MSPVTRRRRCQDALKTTTKEEPTDAKMSTKTAVKTTAIRMKSKRLKSSRRKIKPVARCREEDSSAKAKMKFEAVTVKSEDGKFDVICIPEYPEIKIKVARRGKHPYTCIKCNLGFFSKKAYDAHAPVHVLRKLKPLEKKFRCDICAMEFGKLCDVDRHMRVHTGEKPSVCNICNKGFQQAHNLSKHLLTHLHIKPFQCEICNKGFGRVDVLARHLLTHSLDKPFKCWVCQKGFIRQSQLTHHHGKYHPSQPLVKPEPDDD